MHVLMMLKRYHLIMIVIIKKGESVNVSIHDFNDAQEESNKVASKDKGFLKFFFVTSYLSSIFVKGWCRRLFCVLVRG